MSRSSNWACRKQALDRCERPHLTLVGRVGADRRWRLNLVRTRAQKSAFELDRTKAVANVRKQGILLADAALVLEEERAITLHQEAQNEQRWVTIGMDALARVLTVACRCREDSIRILN